MRVSIILACCLLGFSRATIAGSKTQKGYVIGQNNNHKSSGFDSAFTFKADFNYRYLKPKRKRLFQNDGVLFDSYSILGGNITFVDAGTGYVQMRDQNSFPRIWFETIGANRTIFDIPGGGYFAFRDYDGNIVSRISETVAPTFSGVLTGTTAFFSSDVRTAGNLFAVNGKMSLADAGSGYVQMRDESSFPRIWFETVDARRTILDVPNGGSFAFRDYEGNIIASVSQADVASFKSNVSANGTLTAKKIKVTQAGWSDYVFDDGYTLRSLSSLEKYISQNKHLPDVPSASEVSKKGIDIGETQALLLKKIEELTLYIINQQKQIEAQGKRISSQQAELGSLRKAINVDKRIK